MVAWLPSGCVSHITVTFQSSRTLSIPRLCYPVGLKGLGDSFKKPYLAKRQFHPRTAYRCHVRACVSVANARRPVHSDRGGVLLTKGWWQHDQLNKTGACYGDGKGQVRTGRLGQGRHMCLCIAGMPGPLTTKAWMGLLASRA